jgi:hypothetical protein
MLFSTNEVGIRSIIFKLCLQAQKFSTACLENWLKEEQITTT